MNRKRNAGLGTFAVLVVTGAAFFALPCSGAQDGMPAGQVAQQTQLQQTQLQQMPIQQPQVQQTPIYESEKAWKFEDENLMFFNPSQNQGGVRYIRWKDYNWMVTQAQIIVSDPRPFGTQLQGSRNQMTKDGPQSDKDLMNDLKDQAAKIRKSREPNNGPAVSIGLDLGFGFGGHGHRHHGGGGPGHHPGPGPMPPPHHLP
jgi:hypothetical protein